MLLELMWGSTPKNATQVSKIRATAGILTVTPTYLSPVPKFFVYHKKRWSKWTRQLLRAIALDKEMLKSGDVIKKSLLINIKNRNFWTIFWVGQGLTNWWSYNKKDHLPILTTNAVYRNYEKQYFLSGH